MATDNENNTDNASPNDKPDETPVQSEPYDQQADTRLSLDATLELLVSHERRVLLQHLIEAPDNTATVNELVTQLIQRHSEKTGERPPHNELEVRLHHAHLPKLADAGVIDYDPRSEEVRYWHNDRLETWIDRIRAEESR